MSSSSTYRKQHSKAQSALHKAATQERADQNAATQASRQSWRELAYRRVLTRLAAFSKRTKKSKSRQQFFSTIHKDPEVCVVREELDFISNLNKTTLFVLSFLFSTIYLVHACGVRVVFLEHGDLGYLQLIMFNLKSWTCYCASFTVLCVHSSL